MRAKRAKQYRKLMKQYELSFNFREPYQVLLDSQFIIDAHKFKMHLGKMLENTLSGTIKPMITQCTIRHLYALPTPTPPDRQAKDSYIEVAKAAERRRCDHHELSEPLSTLDCLKSVVDPKDSGTNRHRYVVASQDPEIRAAMREIVGVPLIYINRSVMILEPMGSRTEEVRDMEEKGKVRAGLKGRRAAEVIGQKRKRENGDEETAAEDDVEQQEAPNKRKLKGPSGPNPLSVKKAKKERDSVAKQVEDERAVVRRVAGVDPQAVEKALDARVATEESGDIDIAQGPRKRKRKRKPTQVAEGAVETDEAS